MRIGHDRAYLAAGGQNQGRDGRRGSHRRRRPRLLRRRAYSSHRGRGGDGVRGRRRGADRAEARHLSAKAKGLLSKNDFAYEPETDSYRCPAGQRLPFRF